VARKRKGGASGFLNAWKKITHPHPLQQGWRLIGIKGRWMTVELWAQEQGIHISSIHVFPDSARTGLATEVMGVLSEMADEFQVELRLNAKPFGEPKIPKRKLKSFYRRFGFEQDYGDHMVRAPR